MVSQLKVNEIIKQSGSSISIGETGDTVSGPFTNVPTFTAHKTSGQSLSSGVFTKITFDAEEIDTNNGYSTSTSTYTVQVAGYYNLFYNYRFDSATDFDNTLVFMKYNGTTNIMSRYGVNRYYDGHYVAFIKQLNVGDTLEVYGYQASGSSYNFGGGNDNGYVSVFGAMRLIG